MYNDFEMKQYKVCSHKLQKVTVVKLQILCEMLKTKIHKDHYVHIIYIIYIVTYNPWILHKKTEKYFLIVCPNSF